MKIKTNLKIGQGVFLGTRVFISFFLILATINVFGSVTKNDGNNSAEFISGEKIGFNEVEPDSDIFIVVEELPEYPGGDEARMKFLQENIKYPKQALDSGLQGTVIVHFIVEPDGSLSNIEIGKEVCESIDNECIRVVKLMPKWKPGKQRGKLVRVAYRLPITFALQQ